LNCMYQFMKQG